jgi:ComEC/Rec2-related protein
LLIGAAVLGGVLLGFPAVVVGVVLMGCLKLLGVPVSTWRAELILAFLLAGAIRHPAIENRIDAGDLALADRAIGEVDSIPVARPGGDRLILRVHQARIDGQWVPAGARTLAYISGKESITIGDTIEVVWTLTPLNAMPPGLRGFTVSQDAVGSAQIWSLQLVEPSSSIKRHLVGIRRTISDRMQELVPGDAGALMSGIVTGDDSALSSSARLAFLATGTSHVTAVSGSNVAMLLALWGRAFRRRTRRHNLWVQAGIVASIWLYCAATGLEPSALRAATVATLIVASGRFGRRADPMTILLLASAGLLLWQPHMTRSVGFWLSVVASAALIGNFAFRLSRSLMDDFRATLLGLLAVQFATLPLIVWTFGVWSPISILANILIAPVMTIAFPVTFIFAVVSFVPVIGSLAVFAPALLSDLTLSIVDRLTPVLPAVSMEPIGPAGLWMVALPCLVVLCGLSTDTRRWWPRLRVMALEQPSIILVSAGGLLLGGIGAIAIFTRFWV